MKITKQEAAVMSLVRDAMTAYRRTGDGLNLHEMNLWLRRAVDYFTALEQRREIAAQKAWDKRTGG